MNNNYKIEYYRKLNREEPVKKYINDLSGKIQAKIFSYLELLKENKGQLKYPYTGHIIEKIWELRIDFAKSYHRIFYFIFINKRIILLHAFFKKTNKTPQREIEKAINNYKDFIKNN